MRVCVFYKLSEAIILLLLVVKPVCAGFDDEDLGYRSFGGLAIYGGDEQTPAEYEKETVQKTSESIGPPVDRKQAPALYEAFDDILAREALGVQDLIKSKNPIPAKFYILNTDEPNAFVGATTNIKILSEAPV